MNLGFIYELLERHDEALDVYHKGIQYHPLAAPVHYHIGMIYEKKGLIQEAVHQYQQVQKLNPEFQLVKDRLAALESR